MYIMYKVYFNTFFTTFSFSGALSKSASKASLSTNQNKWTFFQYHNYLKKCCGFYQILLYGTMLIPGQGLIGGGTY